MIIILMGVSGTGKPTVGRLRKGHSRLVTKTVLHPLRDRRLFARVPPRRRTASWGQSLPLVYDTVSGAGQPCALMAHGLFGNVCVTVESRPDIGVYERPIPGDPEVEPPR